MRKKLSEIDSYEAVLCLFVVMIHVLSDSVDSYPVGSFLSALSFISTKIITFAVPAFIISSGIKFAHTYTEGNFSYTAFLKRRITKIYIPYLLVAAVYYLYFVFHRHYFPFDGLTMVRYLGLGTIAAPFYFIIIIMQFYILAPITLGFCKRITPTFGIILAGIITILAKYFLMGFKYADRVFLIYYVYWIIGCYIGINFDMNLERLRRKKKTFFVIGTALTIIYTAVSYFEFLFNTYNFATEILKIFFAGYASIMWLIIMPKYEHAGADILSPATYYIFLIHCLVIFETEHIMELKNITDTAQRFWITLASAYLISITLSVIYSKIKLIFVRDKEF